MNVWLIWVQEGDSATWLEAAWDDESTAENRSGYEAEMERIERMCLENPSYAMRIQCVEVPGVYELFEFPVAQATVVEDPA